MTLLDTLLDKPVGPEHSKAPRSEIDLTSQIELSGNSLVATIKGEPGTVNEGTALDFLETEGLNPDEWEATGFRKSEWGDGLQSVRFTYKRVVNPTVAQGVPLDDLIAEVMAAKPVAERMTGPFGKILALGDMQWGKIDGDGVEGTLERAYTGIDQAKTLFLHSGEATQTGHLHIAWLGDHVEGFVSQGGANVWRTQLTMSEQIRLTRRLMMYAMTTFAPLVDRLTMAAVPGNHGEPQRFSGKGITRYDDSHDTESLIAVADAAALNKDAFGHVEFYVPRTDEMTVVLDVAGTRVGHVHGHQWRPGQHEKWWQGQSFGENHLGDVDLLLAGHLHHAHIEELGRRTFVQVPSLESESTWWKNLTGTPGNPGMLLLTTKDGALLTTQFVR